jgi:hypothetical protein
MMATMSERLREAPDYLCPTHEAAVLMDEMAKVMEEMQQEWHHMIGFSSPKRFHDLNGKAEAILTRFREAG